MTTKIRRSFTDEFKQETVALLESSGRPLGRIAAELGIQAKQRRAFRVRATDSTHDLPVAPNLLNRKF